MIRRLTPKELERLVAKYRAQLAITNGKGGGELARIGARIEKRIVREMLSGSGDVTPEQLAAFQRAIRQSIAMGDAGFTDTMNRHVPDVWATAIERTADIAALSVFDERPAARVLEVVDNFDRAIADRSILRTSGGFRMVNGEPVPVDYVSLWREQWNDEWTRTARVIQSRFTGATITGEQWSSVARSLVDDIGSLAINGRMNTEDFARGFVRTKFRELYTDAGIAIGEEAGLDQYISVGIPDDRQSEICYDASRQGPHTLEWWRESQYGIPPRHVMNCRCDMVAVPGDVKWTGQDNPKFDKAAEAEEVAA